MTVVAITFILAVGTRAASHPLTPRSAPAPADDMVLILQRLKAQYSAPNYSRAKEYLASLATDGHWPDIQYENAPRFPWNPHLSRLAQFASAYANHSSPDYHSQVMLDAVKRGLQYYFEKREHDWSISDEWWQNTIGQPQLLAGTLVPLEDVLPADLLHKGLSYFSAPSELRPRLLERFRVQYPSGQNLDWFAQEQLIRGAITRSAEDVTAASEEMQGDIRITMGEGLQADFSFHQHGPQLYNGGYGEDFTVDMCKFAKLLEGTRYAFTHEKLSLLADYLLDGSRYMIRGKFFDYSAFGRTLVRKANAEGAVELISSCDQLAALLPERAGELMALKKHIEGTGAPYSFLGNRYFWTSEFMTHQREGYYISVKMISNRSVGTETLNGENLKGCWLPFGATWILRRGDEYKNIFPVLDWGRLPGVTSPHTTISFVENVTQPESFVGGVSDGTYGAAGMVFDQTEVFPRVNGTYGVAGIVYDQSFLLNRIQTQGRKSWFFFDREMVALGAGITSSRAERIGTTLNQTLLHGAVLIDGHPVETGLSKVPQSSGVFHDGVGYAFLAPAAASVKVGPQSGDWQTVSASNSDTPVTESVFSLWIDHGMRPQNAQYAYAVLPGVEPPQLAEWVAHPPVRVITNTTEQQAVINDQLGVAEIIFYGHGTVALSANSTVEADRRCFVLMVGHDQATRIAVSSPGGEAATVHLTLTTPQTRQRLTFDLPTGELGGKSRVMEVPVRW